MEFFIKAVLTTVVICFILVVAINQIFQWDCENLAEKLDSPVEFESSICWIEVQPGNWVRKEDVRYPYLLDGR